jgi:hypothetical protein
MADLPIRSHRLSVVSKEGISYALLEVVKKVFLMPFMKL